MIQLDSCRFIGGSKGSFKLHLDPNYYIFVGDFKRFCVNTFEHLNTLSRNPGSATVGQASSGCKWTVVYQIVIHNAL